MISLQAIQRKWRRLPFDFQKQASQKRAASTDLVPLSKKNRSNDSIEENEENEENEEDEDNEDNEDTEELEFDYPNDSPKNLQNKDDQVASIEKPDTKSIGMDFLDKL